ARDFLGNAPALGIGLAHAGLHELDTPHLAVLTHDFLGLVVEDELDAFLAGILHFATGAGHVLFVAAIDTGDGRRALADRRAVAVHGSVAATQHDDTLAFHADIRRQALGLVTHLFVGVADQEGQRFVDT